MIRSQRYGTFYCFSPGVMLATFIIEIAYIGYIIFRYKINQIARLSIVLIFLLAVFQLAEYLHCGATEANAAFWSRVGFAAITFLPPVGVHLVYSIAGKSWNNIIAVAYGSALGFAGIFLFGANAFSGYECAGNYVIFQLAPKLGGYYFVYYYFWLFVTTFLCLKFARALDSKKFVGARQSLILFAIGYLGLLLPTLIVNSIKPETVNGKPSIMCGFAIMLATIIVFGIIPRMAKLKNKK